MTGGAHCSQLITVRFSFAPSYVNKICLLTFALLKRTKGDQCELGVQSNQTGTVSAPPPPLLRRHQDNDDVILETLNGLAVTVVTEVACPLLAAPPHAA